MRDADESDESDKSNGVWDDNERPPDALLVGEVGKDNCRDGAAKVRWHGQQLSLLPSVAELGDYGRYSVREAVDWNAMNSG